MHDYLHFLVEQVDFSSQEPINKAVYNGIRASIVNGYLPVGVKINEMQIANALNVSRTPIREAIRQLIFEGYLQTIENYGTIVKKVTLRDVEEVYQIREALENIVFYNAMINMEKKNFDELDRILDETIDCYYKKEFNRVVDLSTQFNIKIHQYSNMPRVQELLQVLFDYLHRFRTISMTSDIRGLEAILEHKELVAQMRSQNKEGIEEVLHKHLLASKETIVSHFKESEEDIAIIAKNALIKEVTLDYKPGLVCKNSQGAHTDMNYQTFINSIDALYPHFKNYEIIGLSHTGNMEGLFKKLREEGIKAEVSMFEATSGINTHKGANFIFAILIGVAAYLLHNNRPYSEFKETIVKVTNPVFSDFAKIKDKKDLSHGEKVFLKYNAGGIRQEAMLGFPILFDYKFSHLNENEESLYEFLIGSMRNLNDTTILHRAKIDGLNWTKNYAKTLTPQILKSNFKKIDEDFKKKNISPGGSADFLGAAIFMRDVKKIMKER